VAIRLPTASRNAACDAVVDRLDAGSGPGKIEIRSGSQPASAGDSATGTLLATVVLADPAFGNAGASSPGQAALVDPGAVVGVAAGTAGWFRAMDSDSTTVLDGSVTATGGGGDLTLATTTISVGLSVDITGGPVTMPG
jgi:hypothetical protein